ncbi:MAG: hypothetical protein WC069_00560 [Candidatus Shapirobacteria bacterium]
MKIDTPFNRLQIKLIDLLISYSQFAATSQCIDVEYDHIQQNLSLATDEQIMAVIENVCENSGNTRYTLTGDMDGWLNNKPQTNAPLFIFSLDEEALENYLRLLKARVGNDNKNLFNFKFRISIDLKESTITYKTTKFDLPLGKNGIKLLKLLLYKYPGYVSFKEIDREFGLDKMRKTDPRIAEQQIYETRDDLLNYLTNSVGLTIKTAKQFVRNIRGVGYKISLRYAK